MNRAVALGLVTLPLYSSASLSKIHNSSPSTSLPLVLVGAVLYTMHCLPLVHNLSIGVPDFTTSTGFVPLLRQTTLRPWSCKALQPSVPQPAPKTCSSNPWHTGFLTATLPLKCRPLSNSCPFLLHQLDDEKSLACARPCQGFPYFNSDGGAGKHSPTQFSRGFCLKVFHPRGSNIASAAPGSPKHESNEKLSVGLEKWSVWA